MKFLGPGMRSRREKYISIPASQRVEKDMHDLGIWMKTTRFLGISSLDIDWDLERGARLLVRLLPACLHEDTRDEAALRRSHKQSAMTMNVDEEIGRLKEEITRLGLPQSDGSVSVLSIFFLHIFIFLLCFFCPANSTTISRKRSFRVFCSE
jgi:hypothetical protein